jgi:hypothetical protein
VRGPGVSRTLASRFVFEAERRTATDLGGAIAERLTGTDPSAALPAASTGAVALLNRYLGEVGIVERYARLKVRKPKAGILEDRCTRVSNTDDGIRILSELYWHPQRNSRTGCVVMRFDGASVLRYIIKTSHPAFTRDRRVQ